MNLSSLNYLIKEGFKNIRSNAMMSFASVGVMVSCLLLTGAAILFSANITNIVQDLQGENVINVYLKQETSSFDALKIEYQLLAISNVDTATYVSKQEALAEYNQMLGSVFNGITEQDNFLPDAYKITMKDLSLYDSTIAQIKNISAVDTINDKSDAAAKLSSLNTIVTVVGFWLVLVLGIISLFIVSNTIKVTMYSRRLEINIMKSVGATNWFIRLPFIIEGTILGLVSALVADILLKVIYDNVIVAMNKVIAFGGIPFSTMAGKLCGGFICAGIIFGALGGVFSITKYLNKEGEEVIGL